MENILVIKHGALGDFVLALGSMRMIRRRHPKARLTLLTMAPFRKIAEQSGIFDDYIIDNRVRWWRLAETRRVLGAILSGGYTRVYDLQDTQRTSIYRFLWRRFAPAGLHLWFAVNPCAENPRVYMVGKCARCCPGKKRTVPYTLRTEMTDLSFLHGEEKYFDRLPERYVLLIPGSSAKHTYKRWPVAHYREIVRRLAERGVKAVLLGTQNEAAEAESIADGFDNVVNMVGLTGLMDVPQVARRALAVLGNDTGPSHMAAFTGVFTVSIIDQRNPRSILRGPNCRSLISPGSVDCISPDEVWQLLDPHLSA